MIKKSLNLDDNISTLDSGSLLHAMNMELDNITGDLTVEHSHETIIAYNDGTLDGEVVGSIPCSDELVLFTSHGNIYRYDEKRGRTTLVESAWQWSGGKIKGTYTYNVDNDLIISIAEVVEGGNIPLKIINLNKCSASDNSSIYTLTPKVPIVNIKSARVNDGGSIEKGIYNFFIRHKINEVDYTSWFAIGSTTIVHDCEFKAITESYTKNRASGGKVAKSEGYHVFQSDNKYANKHIDLLIDINTENSIYDYYQIGCIVTTSEKATKAYRTYDIARDKFDIRQRVNLDKSKLLEHSVIDITSTVYGISNVKSVANYGNRLYIANYEEANLDIDYPQIKDVKLSLKVQERDVAPYDKLFITKFEGNIYDITFKYSLEGKYGSISGIYTKKLTVIDKTFFLGEVIPPDINCTYTFVNYGSDRQTSTGHIGFGMARGNIDRAGNCKSVYFKPDGVEDPNKCKWDRLVIKDNVNNTVQIINFGDTIVKNTSNTADVKSYEGKDTYDELLYYKTLIPGEVYNFFLHFVRPDGTFTNGIRIDYHQYTLDVPYYKNASTGEEIIVHIKPSFTLNQFKVEAIKQGVLKDGTKLAFDTNYQALIDEGYGEYKFCQVVNVGYYENEARQGFIRVPNVHNHPNKYYHITPVVANIKLPPEFDGYFISYEEPEYINVASGYIRGGDVTNGIRFNCNELDFDSFDLKGYLFCYNRTATMTKTESIDTNCCISTDDNLSVVHAAGYYANNMFPLYNLRILAPDSIDDMNKGREACIAFNVPSNSRIPLEFDQYDFIINIGRIVNINTNIYSSTTKKLIPLGYVKTRYDAMPEVLLYQGYCSFNLDGYNTINFINHFIGDNGVRLNDNGEYVNLVGLPYDSCPLKIVSYATVSNKLFELKSIHNATKPIVTVIDDVKYLTKPISPDSSADLFKYDINYMLLHHKPTTNVNKNNLTKFSKTIRRSNVMQSESRSTSWRIFEPNNYRTITENKGDITNIVGSGLYLLAHTEHSLFVFNRNSALQTLDREVQLHIPDSFDIDYQEVFTSSKGYAGLQDIDSWCMSEYGYIFFDRSANKIYRYDSNALEDITNGVSRVFEDAKTKANLSDIIFGIDKKYGKLLVHNKTNDAYSFTLSYHLGSKAWISGHNHRADHYINTKQQLYSIVNDNVIKYAPSQSESDSVLDFRQGYMEASVFNNTVDTVKNVPNAYVDVVFTESYNIVKVLEHISYTTVYEGNTHYSGNKLFLYSNSCYSGEIDLTTDTTPTLNDYNKPVYNTGTWYFNYFRNTINQPSYVVDRIKGELGGVIDNLDYDGRTLMYGNYIVARFVFSDIKVSLEDLTFNVSKL